eukprot:COSAG01_NODE_3832_length_5650_cov_80.957485_4_plen_94_part_00
MGWGASRAPFDAWAAVDVEFEVTRRNSITKTDTEFDRWAVGTLKQGVQRRQHANQQRLLQREETEEQARAQRVRVLTSTDSGNHMRTVSFPAS